MWFWARGLNQRMFSRSVLVMNPGNACRNRVGTLSPKRRIKGFCLCVHGTIAATRRFLFVQPWRTCNFLPVGSLVYGISSTQWLKCDPGGNNTLFSSRDACQYWNMKPFFIWNVQNRRVSVWISFTCPVLWPTEPEASSPCDVPFAASSYHKWSYIDLKENQQKNM